MTNVYTRKIYRVECLCMERIFFSSQSLQPMHVISQHSDYQIHRVYGCWERGYFVTNSSNPYTIFNFTVLAWWIYRIGCVCVWLYFVNLVNHKCWGVFCTPPPPPPPPSTSICWTVHMYVHMGDGFQALAQNTSPSQLESVLIGWAFDFQPHGSYIWPPWWAKTSKYEVSWH